MKIGAHLSVAGGYLNPLEKIIQIGGNCLQIFSSSPRNWSVAPVSDEEIAAFRAKKSSLKIDPIFFHASYLINLANPDRIGQASINTLIGELHLAEAMEVRGTIIHLGSYNSSPPYNPLLKGEGRPPLASLAYGGVRSGGLDIPNPEKNSYSTLLKNIAEVLTNAPQAPYFIIENAGNKKIGQSIEEIGRIVNDLKDSRVKVCLDTCHLFAAGYDLATKEKYKVFIDSFDSSVGLENLVVIQVNDSKDPLGSFRDRHENIGEGTIPPETFRLYLNEPETKNLPFILETPGFDKKGPDKKNLDLFKNFRSIDNTDF